MLICSADLEPSLDLRKKNPLIISQTFSFLSLLFGEKKYKAVGEILKNFNSNWMWWNLLLIAASGRQSQADSPFEASLLYIVGSSQEYSETLSQKPKRKLFFLIWSICATHLAYSWFVFSAVNIWCWTSSTFFSAMATLSCRATFSSLSSSISLRVAVL